MARSGGVPFKLFSANIFKIVEYIGECFEWKWNVANSVRILGFYSLDIKWNYYRRYRMDLENVNSDSLPVLRRFAQDYLAFQSCCSCCMTSYNFNDFTYATLVSRSARSPRDTTYTSIFALRLKNHYSLVIDTNRVQIKRSICHSSIAAPCPRILISASWSILWNSNKISIWSEFRMPTSKSSLTRCWRYTLKQSESDARFSKTYRIK